MDGNHKDITGIWQKKGIIKGETLRLSRTNSERENFEQSRWDLEWGYPVVLVQTIRTEVKFTDRNNALRNKTKQTKENLPFVTTYNTYNPTTPKLKKTLVNHWAIIHQQPIKA